MNRLQTSPQVDQKYCVRATSNIRVIIDGEEEAGSASLTAPPLVMHILGA